MTIRILIADDHCAVGEGLRYLIQAQADMEVIACVEDGRQAVRWSMETRPDVVLMDNPPGWAPMKTREKEFVIAVVDGEAALREALSNLLRPAGYGVKTFASAEDFLGSEGWHIVDCLILDAQLPGMSGLELQRHLAAKGFQVPVIFVTQDKDGQMTQALRDGALAFLRKPFEDEDLLLRAVQRACTR